MVVFLLVVLFASATTSRRRQLNEFGSINTSKNSTAPDESEIFLIFCEKRSCHSVDCYCCWANTETCYHSWVSAELTVKPSATPSVPCHEPGRRRLRILRPQLMADLLIAGCPRPRHNAL